MAMTFLPFVTTSTPSTKIYSSIIEKAPNINLLSILKILYALHKNGLDAVRNEFKRQSELSEQAAYDAVADAFSITESHNLFLNFHNIEVMTYIVEITKANGEEIPKDLDKLSKKQIGGFYLVMSILELCESKLPFNDLVLNMWTTVIEELPDSVKFDDNGSKTIRFKSEEELEAFIVYWGCLSEKPLDFTVHAVLDLDKDGEKYDWGTDPDATP